MTLTLDPKCWSQADGGMAAPPLDEGEAHLWLFSLDEPAWSDEAISACLDASEQERAARFHFDIHRRRFIAGRGQLRYLLGKYLGLPAGAIAFDYGPQGKPMLAVAPGERRPLEFNLSHSDGFAFLGITRDAAIGVDIEAARGMDDAGNIARDNFSPEEVAIWDGLPQHEQLDGFFACWSRKEAIVKALGGGLSIPLDSFQVTLDPAQPAKLVSIGGGAARWTLWGERPLPGYWAAMAVEAPAVTVRRICLGSRSA